MSTNFAHAAQIGDSDEEAYTDAVEPGVTYTYWLEPVGYNGTIGTLSQPHSTTSGNNVAGFVEALGDLTAAHLSPELTNLLDQIISTAAAAQEISHDNAINGQTLYIDTQYGQLQQFVEQYKAELDTADSSSLAQLESQSLYFATQTTALAQQISALTSQVTTDKAEATAAINQEQMTRTSEVAAVTTMVTALDASLSTDISDANALINSEAGTRANAVSAVADQVTQLQTDFQTDLTTTQALVTQEASTRSAENTAMAQTISGLSATLTATESSVDASLSDQDATLVTLDAALASTQQSLVANYNTLSANINSTALASASATSAVAGTVSNHTTQIGDMSTTVSTTSQSVDGILGKYGVTIDANGRAAGFGLLNGTGGAAFDIVADNFSIANPDSPTVKDLYYDSAANTLKFRGQLILSNGANDTYTVTDLSDIQAQDGDTIYTEFAYSSDDTNWHSQVTAGDTYIRSRTVTNGTEGGWSSSSNLKGDAGSSYTGTTEYYKLTNSTTAPTIASGSWLTSPQNPTASKQYLWNYNSNTRTIGDAINSPVSLITQYVEDGVGISAIGEEYAKSSSGTTAPASWGTYAAALPLSDTSPYLWNKTTTTYTDLTTTSTSTIIAIKGIDADALTVSTSTTGGVTTLTFSDGTTATVDDGAPGATGTASGVKIIYASDTSGTGASFTQGSLRYANYYEWTGSAPTTVPSGLTYTLFIGEDGDNAGVVPVYADDASGTNASLTDSSKDYVNFYEWTVTAPTSPPSGLTYVQFVGDDGYTPVKGADYYDGTGRYISYVFKTGASVPTTPTTGTYNGTTETVPTNWSDDPVHTSGNITWVSKATYTQQLDSNGGASTTWNRSDWATPTKFYEKGDSGADSTVPGPPGSDSTVPGPTGNAGAGFYRYGSSTGVWPSTSTANSYLSSAAGRAAVTDDVLTIYKTSDTTVSETRRYTGSTWVTAALLIDGDMIATGTIRGDRIVADTIDATHIESGSITTDHIDGKAIFADNITIDDNIEFATTASGIVFGKSSLGDANPGAFYGRSIDASGNSIAGFYISSATSGIYADTAGNLSLNNVKLFSGQPGSKIGFTTAGTHTQNISTLTTYLAIELVGGGAGACTNGVPSVVGSQAARPGAAGAATWLKFYDNVNGSGNQVGATITANGAVASPHSVRSNTWDGSGMAGTASSQPNSSGAGGTLYHAYTAPSGSNIPSPGTLGGGGGGAGANGYNGSPIAATYPSAGSGVTVSQQVAVPSGAVSVKIFIGAGGAGGVPSGATLTYANGIAIYGRYGGGSDAKYVTSGAAGGSGYASIADPYSGGIEVDLLALMNRVTALENA